MNWRFLKDLQNTLTNDHRICDSLKNQLENNFKGKEVPTKKLDVGSMSPIV